MASSCLQSRARATSYLERSVARLRAAHHERGARARLLALIDTHCHLDVERFAADRAGVIARAAAAGVVGILVPAIRPATWRALVELCRSSAMLRVALGVHPQIVPELVDGEVGDL